MRGSASEFGTWVLPMDSNSARFASVASLCSGDILRPLSVPSMASKTSSTMTSLSLPERSTGTASAAGVADASPSVLSAVV